FQQLYNVVDSMVVGNYLGKDAVAAVGISFPVLFTLISLLIGLAMGSSIVISQYYGAKDQVNLQKAVGTTYILTLGISIILTVISILAVDPILKLMNTPDNIYAMSKTYMMILFAGTIFSAGYNMLTGILRAVGDSKTPLYFLIIATILNIILDLLFVLQFKMGVAGVAIATITAQASSFFLCSIYIKKTNPSVALTKKNLVYDKGLAKQIIKLGIPSGLQQMIVALSIFVLQGIVNSFGSDVIAGYSLAGKIDSMCIMFYMTIGMAISTFTGQNIGAG
ncbi:MAG: MATE family efflux transporter, partial [Clostridiales bacterium]